MSFDSSYSTRAEMSELSSRLRRIENELKAAEEATRLLKSKVERLEKEIRRNRH
jgi:predicted nuclease with TOPRIM domain